MKETMARRLKQEYLQKMGEVVRERIDSTTPPAVDSLPIKSQGRPMLLGEELDKAVQESLHGGVVNTTIVIAAAEGKRSWHAV